MGSDFFYGADRDAKGVFAMKEVKEDYDAFGTVAGEEDGLEFFVAAAVDSHPVSGLKLYGFLRFFAESMFKLVDEFVSYSNRLFTKRH